uniref:Uncharacterized protein n=1 Tax=Trepomonas sp. PC1 TaxID=1076344 RepID=A0A146JXB2_9EUKA|eukprot:JAP89310.1 Hypothetical protein TPC1_31195 [Trepomonas sp. PC1]
MGCGISQQPEEAPELTKDDEQLPYSVNFGQHFKPELFAGEFIEVCIENLTTKVTDQDFNYSVSSNNLTMGTETDRPTVDRKVTNVEQLMDEFDISFLEAVNIEDSEDMQFDLFFRQQFKQENRSMKPTREKISFLEMLDIIRRDLRYVRPQDLFALYILQDCKPITQNQLQHQFRQFDQQACSIPLQKFLLTYYLASPEQFKRIISQPLYILFYCVDFNYNQIVSNADLLGSFSKFATLTKPQTKVFNQKALFNLLQFESLVLNKLYGELELQIEFSAKRNDVSAFLKKEKEKIKTQREKIGANIERFLMKMSPSVEHIVNNRSQAQMFDAEKSKIQLAKGLDEM